MLFWPRVCVCGRVYRNLNISIIRIFTTRSTFLSQGRAQLTSPVPLHCSSIIPRLVPASPFCSSEVRRQSLFGQPVFPSGSVVCLLFPCTVGFCHCCGKRAGNLPFLGTLWCPRTSTLGKYILLNDLIKNKNTGNLCKAGGVLAWKPLTALDVVAVWGGRPSERCPCGVAWSVCQGLCSARVGRESRSPLTCLPSSRRLKKSGAPMTEEHKGKVWFLSGVP